MSFPTSDISVVYTVSVVSVVTLPVYFLPLLWHALIKRIKFMAMHDK